MRRMNGSIFGRSAFNQSVIAGIAAVSTLAGAHNPTAPNAAEVAISSATVPPGGTVQMRFTLTQPRPIMSTGTGFALDGFNINGIALWSTNGVACGVGTVQGGVLHFSAADPSGILGSGVDYPFLTVALTAPQGLATGTSFPFNWTPDAWLYSPAGPLDLSVKPGKVTIGGSLSIEGVYPGGGTYQAGTTIRIAGSGFQKGSKIQTPVKYSSISIMPNEIDLTLKEQTTMDSQMFQVASPDGSSATYFSYLKGIPVRPPSNDLLKSGEYAFPLQTHAIATVSPAGVLPAGEWLALALQNPNPGPASVTITLQPGGPGRSALIVLPPAGRIVDTVSGLLNGLSIQPGDSVIVTSTAMIQVFGIHGDENANTLKPFLPNF